MGKVLRTKKAKNAIRQGFVWTVWSRQAAALLVELKRFLIVKKKHATICVEFQKAMRYPGRNGLTNAEWALRRKLFYGTKNLNYGRHIPTRLAGM